MFAVNCLLWYIKHFLVGKGGVFTIDDADIYIFNVFQRIFHEILKFVTSLLGVDSRPVTTTKTGFVRYKDSLPEFSYAGKT